MWVNKSFRKPTRRALVTLSAIFFCSMIGFSQSDSQTIDFTDTIQLSNSARLKGYSSLDSSALAGKEIFIAGENHTYLSSNSKLWIQNIRYLHKYAGVRNIIMENGRSNAWLINSYIQTGDTALYNVLKKYVFEEYADVYKLLMKFNSTLDSNNKVRVIGIDLERGSYGALKVLSLLIPQDKQAHDSIDLHIESLIGMAMYQDREIFKGENGDEESDNYYGYTYSARSTLSLVIDNFGRHEERYKTLMGENFPLFKDVLMGLKDTRYWNGLENQQTIQDYVYREMYMYNRFIEEYGKHSGNYYGQFGRCHATKKKADKNSCEWYVFKSLANRLKESKEADLKDRILTLGILYKSDDDYTLEDWSDVTDHIDQVFDQLEDNRILLYDLRKDTSLQKFFVEDFDYLFFNTNHPSEDHPYYTEDYDFGGAGEQRIKFGVTCGQYEVDMASIGRLHNSENGLQINKPLVIQGGYFSTMNADVKGLTSGTYLGFVSSIESYESDSLGSVTSKLGGFVYKSLVLYDLYPNMKVIDVLVGGSLGYSQLTVRLTKENNTSEDLPITSGIIGERSTSIYKNPALTGSLIFGIDLNLGRITIGSQIGATYDMSKKNWRLDGELLSTGPETSLRGMFGNVHVGLNFDI